MGKKLVALAITLGLWCGIASAQAEEKKEETTAPPVTKIVFYKHGMGYFERIGSVKDNAVISLGFKTNQMPDLLTSLFAIDLSGNGKITTIGYDSKDPIDKQLENILIRVPEGAALTQFLAQLKGAKVEVKIASETSRGSILGIEPLLQKVDNTVITSYKLILLRDDGAIQPVNLLDISTIRLLDDPIQKDLQRILDIYLRSKYTDRKTVKLEAVGKGQRDILMGYLVEMPIWKTSYRLILGDKKPYLQGWAIVENPTDEDWTNVQMSFVAGNPISFKMDLYTSYYPIRPEINLSSITGSVGRANLDAEGSAGESEDYEKDAMDAPKSKMRMYAEKKSGAPAAPGFGTLGKIQDKSMSELMQSSVQTIATGIQIGELFSYNSQTPVSINRHQSAMVPIVTDTVEGQKVLYYRATISSKPLNAFYLNNSTKMTLETGPVTFFEGSTSVGEGLLRQSLAGGMKEIIPYALETTCSIEPVTKQNTKPIHKVSYANGAMVLRQFYVNETTYKCINKSDKSYTFYLDHPRNGNYTLMEPAKAEEEIPGYYRFKIDLGANQPAGSPADRGKTVDFKVVEQVEGASSIYLQNTNLDQITLYITQPYLNKRMKEFLGEVKGLLEAVATQQRVYNEANQEFQRLTEDQKRYRDNMGSLNSNNPKESEIRESYVDKLQNGENRILGLRQQMLDSNSEITKLRAQLSKKIQEFSEE
ncbi:MAG: DUF4139 domain-containing protein [Planctomycetota bacterium]